MATISKLAVRDFKRIILVDIEPRSGLVTLRGNNGNGKSSVLDAVAAAFGGAKLCPAEPIRRGQETAEVTVELDDGMVVTRTWERRKGKVVSRLEVKAAGGRVLTSPQSVLDKLIGKLSFDPEAYARLGEDADGRKKQAQILRDLAGVDLGPLEQKRLDTYNERTEVNRELERARAALLDLGSLPDAGEPVAVAELLEEQKAAIAAVEERRELERAASTHRERAKAAAARAEQLRRELESEEAQVKISTAAADAIEAELLTAADPPDLEAINRRILEAQTTNEEAAARQRALDERDRQKALLAELEKQSAEQTAQIERIDQEKERLLAAAKFPVKGLGFGIDGVTFNGLPLEQASQAEQLRVSLAIGLALNPSLKVVQIRNGSLLDDQAMAIVEEMAEAAGAQVWVERVGKVGGGIVIEEGRVAAEEAA